MNEVNCDKLIHHCIAVLKCFLRGPQTRSQIRYRTGLTNITVVKCLDKLIVMEEIELLPDGLRYDFTNLELFIDFSHLNLENQKTYAGDDDE